ncbi:MAG: NAD(P)H-dependent glycerol-3-phosphate dehydrogenase [Actinomycetota bacterium]
MTPQRCAVIGAGSWGTAVAGLLRTNAEVVLWGRTPEVVAAVNDRHENPVYLPGVALDPELRATADLAEACRGADVVVMAVPSHGFRDVLRAAVPAIGYGTLVVSLTKGIEQGTLARMSEIVAAEIPGITADAVAVLTGPNLVREIADGQPTASVVATPDAEVAARLQQLFMTPSFRVYTNPDVVGCEIAGATKNVIAIAVGAAAGFGFGDNARAALITRGLAEMSRLGVALGGDPLTFAGLAGVGDLVATCTSDQSRNRRVGFEFGRGRPAAEIVQDSPMVAEGVRTAAGVRELARRHGVEMPIAELVSGVIEGRAAPQDVIGALMGRAAKAELHGMR